MGDVSSSASAPIPAKAQSISTVWVRLSGPMRVNVFFREASMWQKVWGIWSSAANHRSRLVHMA